MSPGAGDAASADMALGSAFERDGVVRVHAAGPGPDLAAMRDCLRELIAALPFEKIAGAMRPARGCELDLWAIGREPAFAPLPAAIARAADRVFGPGVWAQVEGELGGLAMPNLPCPGAGRAVCSAAWHVDEPTPAAAGAEPGRILIGYLLLDRVEPGGGATAAIAGSPRRLAALAAELAAPLDTDAALAELARAEPWFAALVGPDDPEGAARSVREGCLSDGTPLRVVELTGAPGDLVLMDPRCLHTISANVSTRPRLIMRTTFVRR